MHWFVFVYSAEMMEFHFLAELPELLYYSQGFKCMTGEC